MTSTSRTLGTDGAAVEARALALGGWPQAIRGAAASALVVLGLGLAVAFLALVVGALPRTSAGQAARYGWALFYVFHHVGFVVRTPTLRLPGGFERVLAWPSGFAIDAVLAVALLAGTAVAMWSLARAGRAVGAAVGGPELRRALHGAKVAVPYALLSWAAAWFLRLRVELPGAPSLSMRPSHLASLFWPLAIAAASAAVGGVRSAGEGLWTSPWLWSSEAGSRRWRGAVAGGVWMLALGLALSIAGLGAAAAVQASDTAGFVRAVFRPGFGTGLMAVVLAVLALPNAAAWVLAPAMGGCLEVGGGAGSSLPPYCFLSYTSTFARPLPDTFDPHWGYPLLGGPPAWTFAFVLVPLIAVLAGGAGARRAGQGAVTGAMAGLVFTVLLTALLILSSATARFNGPFSYVATGFFRYGPYPPYGFQLGLAWGVAGGAVGGLLGASAFRRRGSRGPGPAQ